MERLFTLDAQFLFDAIVLAISMLVLFTFLSYLLFEPARDLMENRRQRIIQQQEVAKQETEKAIAYKGEYNRKLKEAGNEIQEMIEDARKKARDQEVALISEARVEANRIISRAQKEILLKQKEALDDMRQEIIAVASLMAQKVAAVSIDETTEKRLFEETMQEIGEHTWAN